MYLKKIDGVILLRWKGWGGGGGWEIGKGRRQRRRWEENDQGIDLMRVDSIPNPPLSTLRR